jgi:hypothetical protein
MLTDPGELDAQLRPVLECNGSEIPASGCYIAAVEFDENGQVVAYQMIQQAIFLEGLWARNHSAHLLPLYRMAVDYAQKHLGANQIWTMTRNDASGNRIGRILERLGSKRMNLNIFRRSA